MKRPTMHAVESSNVVSIGHDGEDLHVTYKSGGTYVYAGVPAEAFDACRKAPSIGKFLHAHIRGKHTMTRLEEK